MERCTVRGLARVKGQGQRKAWVGALLSTIRKLVLLRASTLPTPANSSPVTVSCTPRIPAPHPPSTCTRPAEKETSSAWERVVRRVRTPRGVSVGTAREVGYVARLIRDDSEQRALGRSGHPKTLVRTLLALRVTCLDDWELWQYRGGSVAVLGMSRGEAGCWVPLGHDQR